jgi:hypothetical protein
MQSVAAEVGDGEHRYFDVAEVVDLPHYVELQKSCECAVRDLSDLGSELTVSLSLLEPGLLRTVRERRLRLVRVEAGVALPHEDVDGGDVDVELQKSCECAVRDLSDLGSELTVSLSLLDSTIASPDGS